MSVRKRINELYKEKDSILKENRDRYHQELATKETNNEEEKEEENNKDKEEPKVEDKKEE